MYYSTAQLDRAIVYHGAVLEELTTEQIEFLRQFINSAWLSTLNSTIEDKVITELIRLYRIEKGAQQ